jgi:hypothetical protein
VYPRVIRVFNKSSCQSNTPSYIVAVCGTTSVMCMLRVNRVNSGNVCLQPLLGDHTTVECDVHAAGSVACVDNRF